MVELSVVTHAGRTKMRMWGFLVVLFTQLGVVAYAGRAKMRMWWISYGAVVHAEDKEGDGLGEGNLVFDWL